jgi:tRNA(His) guanylyltransferase
VQKIVSVASSIATATFNALRSSSSAPKLSTRSPVTAYPQFDARVFTIPDPCDVANYFIWRQRDAVRNSIQMAAQSFFSHKQLFNVNTDQMQEMLFTQHGINWHDYPDDARRGRVVLRNAGNRPITYTDKRTNEVQSTTAWRSWWEVEAAPRFSTNLDNPLVQWIPNRETTT